MELKDYTLPQQSAITTSDSNIIVSAGAGSGKTAVLTERVLYFIKNHNYNINDFIILTFTNLAAGEMKDRIRSALTKANLIDNNNVDTAQISTFDSYALALVKKYHQQLNVSKDISIIDSSIISVKKRNIINDIFEEYYLSTNETFKEIIKKYCYKNDADITNLTFDLLEASGLELDSDHYLDNFMDTYYSEKSILKIKKIVLEKLLKETDILLNKIKDFAATYNYPISEKDPDSDTFGNILLNSFGSICNLIYENNNLIKLTNENFEEIYDNFFLYFPNEIPSITSSNFNDFGYSDAKDKIKETIKKIIDKVFSYPKNEKEFIEYFDEIKRHSSLIVKIAKESLIRINEFKTEKQVFEFQDIAKMALSLVKDNKQVRESIKNNTKMIMIDEYQDTSLLQDTFISYIANKNIYMVGDIKQSIYRFRNARSDLFLAKYNKYKANDDGIAIDLNTNFRSRPQVIEDINYIFSAIMSEKMGGANYLEDHMIEAGNATYDLAGPTLTSRNSDILITSSDIDDSDTIKNNIAAQEAKAVALDILDKVKNNYKVVDAEDRDNPVLKDCTYSDFCILADRGTDFDTFAEVFNEFQIPLFVENDEDISDSQIVSVMKNILRLIKIIKNNDYQNKDFTHSFISIARSFLYQYSDQTLLDLAKKNDDKNSSYINDPIMIKLKEIVLSNLTAPISDLFSKIVFELNFYNCLIHIGDVSKYERHLDLFLEHFKSMSKLGYSIDDFLLYLEYINEYKLKLNLTSSKSDIDSVKIMNIHKSKGLEFPIIYFVRLNKLFNEQERKKKYGISKEYGMFFDSGEEKANIIHLLNNDLDLQEDNSEKIRLFYVALTRTKEKMIFVSNNNDNYNHLLNKLSHNILSTLQDNTNIESVYNQILALYQQCEINFTILEHIIHHFGYTLTNYFYSISKEARCQTSLVDAILELKLAMIRSELELFDNDLNETCLYLENKYKSNEIDFQILKIIVEDLGYYISNQFKNNPSNLINNITPTLDTIAQNILDNYNGWTYNDIFNDLLSKLDTEIDRVTFKCVFKKLGFDISPKFKDWKMSTIIKRGMEILEPSKELITNNYLETAKNASLSEIYENIVEDLDIGALDVNDAEKIVNQLGYSFTDDFITMTTEERIKESHEDCLLPLVAPAEENDLDEQLENEDEVKDYSYIIDLFSAYIAQLVGSNSSSYTITSFNSVLNTLGYSLSEKGIKQFNYMSSSSININSLKTIIEELAKNSDNDLLRNTACLITTAYSLIDPNKYDDKYFMESLFGADDMTIIGSEFEEDSLEDALDSIDKKIKCGALSDQNTINKITQFRVFLDVMKDFNEAIIDFNYFISLFVTKEDSTPSIYQIVNNINEAYNNQKITTDELNILNQYINKDFTKILSCSNKDHPKYNELLSLTKFTNSSNNYFKDGGLSPIHCNKAFYWFKEAIDLYLKADRKNRTATLNSLIKIFESTNHLLSNKLYYITEEEATLLQFKDIDSYFLKLKKIDELDFDNFEKLFKYVKNPNYTHRIVDSLSSNQQTKDNSTTFKEFITNNLTFTSKIIEKKRASKQIDLSVDPKALEFGNKIHFIMEVMDLKNPNYSILANEFERNIVRRFLNCSLMNNIANGKIYKEYEFYDSSSNTTGIIDLMVTYDDHIDIIDYKTKNIDDEAYNEQLKVYSNYIKNKFNKKINAYLYSLIDGTSISVIND